MDSNDIKTFINESKEILSTGVASELSYRSAFESLFKKGTNIFPINDHKAANHNKPDFKFVLDSNKELIVGYAEMKAIGISVLVNRILRARSIPFSSGISTSKNSADHLLSSSSFSMNSNADFI